MATTAPVDDQWLVFDVAGGAYAVPAALVREVVAYRRLTPVPRSPASLLGLANLRGEAVPVLSLAALLDKKAGTSRRIVVLDLPHRIGLVVDSVASVVGDAQARDEDAKRLDVDALVDAAFSGLAVMPARRGTGLAPHGAARRPTAQTRLLSFDVGGQQFALPLDEVEEVIAVPAQIAALPGGDAAVVGTVDWRGALLPLLSLAALLGIARGVELRERAVIVRLGDQRIGLIVDMMHDVVAVEDDAVEILPSVLARGGGETRIRAIARLDGGRRLVSVLAIDQLLDEATTAGLRAVARQKAETTGPQIDAAEPVLLFSIAGEAFGLPLAAIDEVARQPDRLTRLPGAPSFVRGLMSLQGHALPMIDQRERFGAVADGRGRIIVARSDKLVGAFLVDAILGVVRVASSALADVPLAGEASRLFDKVIVDNIADGVTLLFSPFALLDGTERELLASLGVSGGRGRS